jgi:hypothetical protein
MTGHNEFQGLMIQFRPHRKLLLERVEDLKRAAASSVWISDSFKSDVRLQSSLTIRDQRSLHGSSSWSEAQCVDRIRKAFPFFSVGTAYDVAREFGGEGCDADDAIAALLRDASLVRAKAVCSVLTCHNVKHCGHPVHGKRPLSAPVTRVKHVVMTVAAIAVLQCLGLLAVGEMLLLKSLVHCLGCIIACAMHAQVVMQNLVAAVHWVVSSPVGAAIYRQLLASFTLLTAESER